MKPLRFYVPTHAIVALLILASMDAVTFAQGLTLLFFVTLAASIVVTVLTPRDAP